MEKAREDSILWDKCVYIKNQIPKQRILRSIAVQAFSFYAVQIYGKLI